MLLCSMLEINDVVLYCIVLYIPDEIHALGLPSSKNTRGMNTTFSYSAKVFDSPFGEICSTPSRTSVSARISIFSKKGVI